MNTFPVSACLLLRFFTKFMSVALNNNSHNVVREISQEHGEIYTVTLYLVLHGAFLPQCLQPRAVDQGARYQPYAQGHPCPTGEGGFRAKPARYHLYVSYACPWAHRTLIFRTPGDLENMISLSVVNWLMAEDGWTFKESAATPEGLSTLADRYSCRRVPVLWRDRPLDSGRRIVDSTRSAE